MWNFANIPNMLTAWPLLAVFWSCMKCIIKRVPSSTDHQSDIKVASFLLPDTLELGPSGRAIFWSLTTLTSQEFETSCSFRVTEAGKSCAHTFNLFVRSNSLIAPRREDGARWKASWSGGGNETVAAKLNFNKHTNTYKTVREDDNN